MARAAAALEIIFLPDSVLFHFILFLCTAEQSPSHSAAAGTSPSNDEIPNVEILLYARTFMGIYTLLWD